MSKKKTKANIVKVPANVSIVGDVYPIMPLTKEKLDAYEITDAPVDSALGLCNQLKGVIFLRQGMTISRTQSTLLHEIMHVIVGHSCLGLRPEREEQIVTLLSQMLFSTLKSNPGLLEFLGAKDDGK